jgi:hypothetical protein
MYGVMAVFVVWVCPLWVRRDRESRQPLSIERTPMGGTSHLPIERRRAQTAKATAAQPPLAQRRVNGGLRWAERYRNLPPEERQRIAIRCVIGRYVWDAKRRGLPTPVFHSYEPVVGDDGKLQAKPNTMRVMTEAEIEAI